jgi:hypothetical protein
LIFYLKLSSCILFAAKHHSAADIIVCLNLFEFVVTSHAAYNHLIDVSCLLSTTKHHSLSFSGFSLFTTHTFGIDHTATNIQSAFNCFHDLRVTHVIHKASHVISSTSSFRTSSIFSVAFILSIQESSALKVSLLCTTYTLLQISAKYNASVTAVFHQPTIMISLHLKNIQSQVAQ